MGPGTGSRSLASRRSDQVAIPVDGAATRSGEAIPPDDLPSRVRAVRWRSTQTAMPVPEPGPTWARSWHGAMFTRAGRPGIQPIPCRYRAWEPPVQGSNPLDHDTGRIVRSRIAHGDDPDRSAPPLDRVSRGPSAPHALHPLLRSATCWNPAGRGARPIPGATTTGYAIARQQRTRERNDEPATISPAAGTRTVTRPTGHLRGHDVYDARRKPLSTHPSGG